MEIGTIIPPEKITLREKLHQLVSIPIDAYTSTEAGSSRSSLILNTSIGPEGGPGGPEEPKGPGVFITPASIVSFPVASMCVSIIWSVIKKVFPIWGDSLLVPFIVSFAVGSAIYYISLTDGMSRKEQNIAIFISIINSFFLAASALGVNVVSNS